MNLKCILFLVKLFQEILHVFVGQFLENFIYCNWSHSSPILSHIRPHLPNHPAMSFGLFYPFVLFFLNQVQFVLQNHSFYLLKIFFILYINPISPSFPFFQHPTSFPNPTSHPLLRSGKASFGQSAKTGTSR